MNIEAKAKSELSLRIIKCYLHNSSSSTKQVTIQNRLGIHFEGVNRNMYKNEPLSDLIFIQKLNTKIKRGKEPNLDYLSPIRSKAI